MNFLIIWQNLIDRKLQCIERKLDTLSLSVGSTPNEDVMSCDSAESGGSGLVRPKGVLPRPDSFTVWGDFLSEIAEGKDKDKRKLQYDFTMLMSLQQRIVWQERRQAWI